MIDTYEKLYDLANRHHVKARYRGAEGELSTYGRGGAKISWRDDPDGNNWKSEFIEPIDFDSVELFAEGGWQPLRKFDEARWEARVQRFQRRYDYERSREGLLRAIEDFEETRGRLHDDDAVLRPTLDVGGSHVVIEAYPLPPKADWPDLE